MLENDCPLTPDEAADEMFKIYRENKNDPEAFHVKADKFLCQILKELDYDDTVFYFEIGPKWYG